ncbi:MAG: hypothetical protein FWF37_04200, partial [Chloroflexi bacterium]|nr:hypothetical protein [Chloroflexota bacterium]
MLKAYPCDLAVLAGYMLIISSQMCETYDMINLHPALPGGPKGTWREVIWQLIEQKAVESGAMMHLVTPELDCGPVATYCRYNLRSADFDELWQQAERQSMQEIRETQGEYSLLFQKIRNEGIRREFPLIVYSLRSFIEGHVYIKDHAIYDKDHKLIDGYDISTVIK